jgi:hypothetical protein
MRERVLVRLDRVAYRWWRELGHGCCDDVLGGCALQMQVATERAIA